MHSRRLPSLTALRAFEAAARKGSVTAAAGELFVTQAAVSRQVRLLEQELGTALFHRVHRAIALTPEGQRLSESLTACFDMISTAVENVRYPANRQLRVSVEPALAARWLVPRLGRFRELCPDIDIILESADHLVSVGPEADVAIRWSVSKREWPSSAAEKLCDVVGYPVMSPEFLLRHGQVKQPGDLLSRTLLFDQDRGFWRQWFSAAGLDDVTLPRGPVFNDLALAIEAALRGEGVVLGEPALISDEVQSGRLIRPFSIHVNFGSYWLLKPSAVVAGPAAVFSDWVRTEISETLQDIHRPGGEVVNGL